MNTISPLRYPGGKSRFVALIKQTLQQLPRRPVLFAEPFCGGAGVSLALLADEQVPHVALNDADPLVASLWQVVLGRTRQAEADFSWLVGRVTDTALTLNVWREQKALRPTSTREAAWKCLFLNRTSFNGILHKSGPIGGWEQRNRTLDVRFNREKLLEQLEVLHGYRSRVTHVGNEDWQVFCARYRGQRHTFLYLDPPYYHRAEQLYGHLFDAAKHKALRDYLMRRRGGWLLSYDDAPEVRALYGGYPRLDARVVDQTYSTHPMGGASFVGRELLISNCQLPGQVPRRTAQAHVGLSLVGRLETTTGLAEGPKRTRISRVEQLVS